MHNSRMILQITLPSPTSFSSFLPSMPTFTLLNILFSNILCSLTTFHTHTKQTSYARRGIITAVFVRIQVLQDATPCLVRSQSPERDVCTSGLLESNLHWIAHFRFPQHTPPQLPNFHDCSFLLPTNGFILPSFPGSCWLRKYSHSLCHYRGPCKRLCDFGPQFQCNAMACQAHYKAPFYTE